MADPRSRVFAALADPTRRDMVARLAGADATVGELAEPYDVTATTWIERTAGRRKNVTDAWTPSWRT
jgi:hypothetical protein